MLFLAPICARRLSAALDKVAKIRMKLETLQQQLEVQSHEVANYYNSLKAVGRQPLQRGTVSCRFIKNFPGQPLPADPRVSMSLYKPFAAQAEQVHSSLQQTSADCRVCYGRRHTQLQEVDKRLGVLTVRRQQHEKALL